MTIIAYFHRSHYRDFKLLHRVCRGAPTPLLPGLGQLQPLCGVDAAGLGAPV
jgi:hypothetical protein